MLNKETYIINNRPNKFSLERALIRWDWKKHKVKYKWYSLWNKAPTL